MATTLTTRCKARAHRQEDIHSRSSSNKRRAVGSSSAQAVEVGPVGSRSISKVAAGEWVQNYAVMTRTRPSSSLYLLRIPPALLHTVCFGDIDPRVLPFEHEHGEGRCRHGPPSSIESVESGTHEPQSQLGKGVTSRILISSDSSTDQSGFDGDCWRVFRTLAERSHLSPRQYGHLGRFQQDERKADLIGSDEKTLLHPSM